MSSCRRTATRDLYVRERTGLGFEVVFRGGNDRSAEFSYRVVAKRRGFEHTRLEPAPWVDDYLPEEPGRAWPQRERIDVRHHKSTTPCNLGFALSDPLQMLAFETELTHLRHSLSRP